MLSSILNRISDEVERWGSCSFSDLKDSLDLSRDDIERVANTLAVHNRIRIKKDCKGEHLEYTWIWPTKGSPKSPTQGHATERGFQGASCKEEPSNRESLLSSEEGKGSQAIPEPFPDEWKRQLEDFVARCSSDPKAREILSTKEREAMSDLLQKPGFEEATKLIWKESRKVSPPWSVSAFIDFLQDVVSHLAIAKNVKTRSGRKVLREEARVLGKYRDRSEGEVREKLNRDIEDLRAQENQVSKTKPKNIGARSVHSYLVHTFRTHFGEIPDRVKGLLLAAAFDWRGPEDARIRISEWASEGLEKPRKANTTAEAFAAIDNLPPEAREARMGRMSPELMARYLGKEKKKSKAKRKG